MYKIWVTQGQGPGTKPEIEKNSLSEALEYVKDHKGEASFAIQCPDGTWYKCKHANVHSISDSADLCQDCGEIIIN